MIKKSIKYLIIASINCVLLITLLILWTDKLEVIFNKWVRIREFLKIIAFTFGSLIAMRILINYFRRKKINNTRLKLRYVGLLTLLICSYLYIDYSTKIASHLIINRQFRNQIVKKIQPSIVLANGTKGNGLKIEEYEQIVKISGFPKIPSEAFEISYDYQYDGFLPDFAFELIYYLPIETPVDKIDYEKGDFSRHQSFLIENNRKKVIYYESER